MRSAILLLFFMLAMRLSAQTPNMQWQRSYGGASVDEGRSITPTDDGGYIIAGTTLSTDGDITSNHGGNDIWLIKTDAMGNIQWQRTYGGSNEDKARCIKQTSDGGYILAGNCVSGDGDLTFHNGGSSNFADDCWIAKLDSAGSIIWQESLGGTGIDDVESIIQTIDGGFVFAGSTRSNDGDVIGLHSANVSDSWVVKLSSSGSIQWSKALGGSSDDASYQILQTSDGNYIVAGSTSSNDGDVSGNHGRDAWVVRLDNGGSLKWQKCYGGSDWEGLLDVVQSNDKGFVLTGWTYSNDGDVSGNHNGGTQNSYDCWVIKVDSLGGILWSKCFGTTGYDNGTSIENTIDGGYLIGATSNGWVNGDVTSTFGGDDYWILKLDGLGGLQWQKTLGGSGFDDLFEMKLTKDHGFIATGRSTSSDGLTTNNHGDNDFWVIKCEDVFQITSATPFICSDTILLTAAPGGSSYQWYGPGIVGATNSQTVTVQSAGVYSVTVTTNGGSAYTSDTIIPIGTVPVADFSAAKTCQNSSSTFIDQSTINTMNWLWRFGDGDTSSLQDPYHVYTTTGSYSVTLLASNACGTDSVQKEIVVHPLPFVALDSLGFPDTMCYWVQHFTLSGGTPSGGLYGGTNVYGTTLYVSGPYTYTVTYMVTDSNGCSNTAYHPVVVLPCTGVDAISDELYEVNVSPNPSNGLFQVSAAFIQSVTVKNILGETLYLQDFAVSQKGCEVDLRQVLPGTYFIKVLTDRGHAMKKIIIVR